MVNKTLIIAEAGVNHNGSIKIAKKLINEASKSGADIIKFQAYKTDELSTRYASAAQYQKKFTKRKLTQYEILKQYEFSEKDFKKIIKYCNGKKIKFLASAFDEISINMLNRLGVTKFKIPSGEITNLPYLRHIGKFNKNIILSSGMANLNEVKSAVNAMVMAGTSKSKITVLHCNSEYPTPITDVNLKAMQTIRNSLRIKVGYSDHTNSIEVPISAVALGASVIEKHITLSRNMKGPDHKTSIEPKMFFLMVKNIRNTEKLLGDGFKKPSRSEKKNISKVRKSIVAARNIKKGEIITKNSLKSKRPGNGLSPMKIDKIKGKIAKKNYQKNQQIKI